MSPDSIDWPLFVNRIKTAETILLTGHVRPDGDCIGSEMALAAVLRQLGKDVRIVNADPTPPGLRFITPDCCDIHLLAEFQDEKWLESLDLLIVLDTISWAQLGPMKELIQSSKAHKMALDHHASGDDIGAEVFSNTQADATGTLAFQAIKHLGGEFTPEIAQALFVAIATDTGWFRFSAVTAQTYEIIAELIHYGAIPHVIYNHLYEQESIGKIRLTGRTLAKVEPFLDGKLVFTSILREDFEQACAIPSDSEDIINQTLLIAGTEMAVIVVEQSAGGFKISFRSRCYVDCSTVAKTFGGGGHRQAAGAFQDLPFEELKKRLVDAMIDAYHN